MKNFTDLAVAPEFIQKLAHKNITHPTAIQCLAIAPLIEGKSLIFRSATGTGKTFAYLIPALQNIINESGEKPCAGGPALMICAPTLELCSQIKTETEFLLSDTKGAQPVPNVSLLIGSMNISRQIDALKKNKPLAVVGNPGRLLLLAKMGKLKCRNLRYVIFDEADRLTADDSREEIAALVKIIADSGCTRLTAAACSATVNIKTREYLKPLLDRAALVETDEQEILRNMIQHWTIFSESRGKTQTLLSFLGAVKAKKALVFISRAFNAGKVVSVLQKHKIPAAGLYGGMDKKERKQAIDRFRSGKDTVLISSDLAARGLDIANISHVIALDVSENKDVYIHRAGRTGRAGKPGIMVSIGDEIDMRRLSALEKKLGITVHPKELHDGRLFN